MRLANGPVTVAVTPLGVRDVRGSVADRSVVYKDAYPGSDSIFLAEKQRVEEFILLRDHHAPRRFEYEVKVVGDRGRIRQLEGVVEVLDSKGNSWLRLEEPYVIDRHGERHQVSAALRYGRLVLRTPASLSRFPALLDPGWTATGSMKDGRTNHTATPLSSGKILVAGGGSVVGGIANRAELYDPKTGTWTTTGTMKDGRDGHTATLLLSGKVLVAGGELHEIHCGALRSEDRLMDSHRKHEKRTAGSHGDAAHVGLSPRRGA